MTELAVARTECATAESIASASAARAGRALLDAGFQSPDEARAAVLDSDRRDDIARQVRTWHDDLASTRARIVDLAQAAGDRDVIAAELDGARAAARLARDRHTALLVEQGRLGSERGELAARIARAAGLHDQLAQHQTTHRICDQLAGDLRTDQFQAHLLEGTFREIVHGAALRLHELSGGRYRLDYAGDDFFVIDGDNARERRRAETLSGGETFLTSLALALQLSEHIQRTAGAVRLDSLFIDEGFGTLDPETLATVGDAIQELSRHHRMVGIITHVQELTASLPARIQVSRGPRGSGVEIVSEA